MCGAVLRYHLAFEGLSKDAYILCQMDIQNQTDMDSGKRRSADRLEERLFLNWKAYADFRRQSSYRHDYVHEA
jgi:hypothetical protein